MASKGENSYRSILKGTSLFGGIQAAHIVISLIRGKFVALLLGPAGMGMAALFTSTADTVQRICSLGLNLAVVKEAAGAREDPQALARVYAVASRMVRLTALLAAMVCLICSSWLSDFAFGTRAQTGQMMLLALAVALTLLWQGKMSLLQGLHRVRELSKATLVGSITALCAGVPLYWLWGTRGIVPAMIVYGAVMLLFYSRLLHRVLGPPCFPRMSQDHLRLARHITLTGIVLMSNDLLNTGGQYVLQAFIRWQGNLADVGLLQGANSLTVQYSGVIFSAMALDFLPRLSAAVREKRNFDAIVNRQTEIVTLITAPLAALLIIFAPLIVRILLMPSFEPAIPLIRIMAATIVLRSACYPLGYVTFAMDNRKVFFWLEGVGCTLMSLLLRVGGYTLYGLQGLCWAMVVDMALTWVIYVIVNRWLYSFRFSAAALRCSLFAVCATALCLAAQTAPDAVTEYTIMGVVAIIAGTVAVRGLRRRMAAPEP